MSSIERKSIVSWEVSKKFEYLSDGTMKMTVFPDGMSFERSPDGSVKLVKEEGDEYYWSGENFAVDWNTKGLKEEIDVFTTNYWEKTGYQVAFGPAIQLRGESSLFSLIPGVALYTKAGQDLDGNRHLIPEFREKLAKLVKLA